MKHAVVKPTEHITLRPYQLDAVNSAMNELKKTKEPLLLELATGAGKSIIIAELSKILFSISKKRILCLAPSKELIEQNHAKYVSYGYEASIFCASANEKCTKNEVIFGSPLSVLKSIDLFKSDFAAVIIDECHKVTATIKEIINKIKESNENLRVIGLTATPYRLGTGYIYEINEEGKVVEQARDPYFKKLIYTLSANELIDQGYLTRPTSDVMNGYDTSSLELSRNGEFTHESIKEAFIVGKGRLTSKIVNEVMLLTMDRKSVMFFAASIEHAKEIMMSIPKGRARLITGETEKKEREEIINDFKDMKFKFIVNVSVLTTGFDAPSVDCIAMLRRTSSAALFQQIIGRGLRLYPGKNDCLILDYAENLKNLGIENDLFSPEITINKIRESKLIECICESCGSKNQFKMRPNKDGLKIDKNGYYVDLCGERITDIDTELDYPAHYGRRCNHTWLQSGEYVRCKGRWSFKLCKECKTENDIAARKCIKCSFELVDPNKRLHLKLKKIENETSIGTIENITAKMWPSKSGNKTIKLDYYFYDKMISVWYFPNSKIPDSRIEWSNLCAAMAGDRKINAIKFVNLINDKLCTFPKKIKYYKKNKFYSVREYEF